MIFPVKERFKLSENFLEQYKGKQPSWGSLGYVTYKRTYARYIEEENRTEEWWETLKRVVEGCYTVQLNHCKNLHLPWNAHKSQKSAQNMYRLMWDFKFLPPGRGLWAMGVNYIYERGSAALNNCFSYETEIITRDGIKKIGDCVDTKQVLLTEGGKWIEAPISSFGKQKLYRIVLKNGARSKKEIFATGDHRWFCRAKHNNENSLKEYKTKELVPDKHVMQSIFGSGVRQINMCPFSIARGFVFGDGTNSPGNDNSNCLYICGDKQNDMIKYFSNCNISYHENKTRISPCPNDWKELISLQESKSVLYGWLAGYFAADGSCSNGSCEITSYNKENINHIKDVCSILGIGTYPIKRKNRVSNLNNKSITCYSICLVGLHLEERFFILSKHRESYNNSNLRNKNFYWTVESVEETDEIEEVYCATVPEHEKFALADNILTGNCSLISTEEINFNFSDPFTFLMDMSMLGVGVAFDTKGSNKVEIKEPKQGNYTYVVDDSKEGWVDIVRCILESYSSSSTKIPNEIDYSKIRPEGSLIKTFGGTAPGPEPLKICIKEIQEVLDSNIGEKISSSDIVDLMNIIGKCVVAGGVRRTAELALGDALDDEYLKLKDHELNGNKLLRWRWASNNSVLSHVGMDYSVVGEQTATNGEPGYFWLENARKYGRLKDGINWKDEKVSGTNPCITGDTLVSLADGRGHLRIDEVEDGSLVYCIDDNNNIAVRPIRHPRITGYKKPIYELVLDDDMKIKCTDNHKFRMKTGEYRELKDLNIGDSLEILTRYKSDQYTMLSYKNDQLYEHNLVAKYSYENKLNNKSENLEYLNKVDIDLPNLDIQFYQELINSGYNAFFDSDKVYVKKNCEVCGNEFVINGVRREVSICSNSCTIKKAQKVYFDKKREENWSEFKEVASNYNHKVIAINFIGYEDVWNGTVDDHHNFFIGGQKGLTEYGREKVCYCNSKNCGEQSLESAELCNLVETFPSRHETYEEYERTLKFAYLFAKTVTLIPTHNERTNAILLRNRRIGLSQSGIAESFTKHGRRTHFEWCDKGYDYVCKIDKTYSDWLCIPESIKKTTVKPSGTVSLLPGVTPGIHYAHSKYYYRTIRITNSSKLLKPLQKAGFYMEDSVYGDNTKVVYFPVKTENFDRAKDEVSIWEQIENVSQMQYYWADNQVSATITFNKEEAKDIPRILELYEDRLKGISFLPLTDHQYAQAPYQEITEDEYLEYYSKITIPDFTDTNTDEIQELFCDGDNCTIDIATEENN